MRAEDEQILWAIEYARETVLRIAVSHIKDVDALESMKDVAVVLADKAHELRNRRRQAVLVKYDAESMEAEIVKDDDVSVGIVAKNKPTQMYAELFGRIEDFQVPHESKRDFFDDVFFAPYGMK